MGLEKKREDFPFFQSHPELIYLDSAATTHKPNLVIDAMNRFYRQEYATVHRGAYSLSMAATEKYVTARNTVQTFLHARAPEEILFTRGSTASLNLLARSLSSTFLGKGDLVLISAIEHHSNIVPWQMAAEEKGLRLMTIPVDDRGDLIIEEYERLLSMDPKVVSVAHVSNAIGSRHPIERIIKAAHQKGALVCIDGAQAASHFPIDVQALDCDFYLFSGHKLYGPTGIGILYGKKEHLLQMKPVDGGGDMIEKVTFEKTTYAEPPLKFEAGTPMIVEAIGLGKAIDYMTSIGLSHIHAWEEKLVCHAEKSLQTISGMQIVGKPAQRGALISFLVDGVHPYDLAMMLDAKSVCLRTGHHCSQPAMAHFGITGTLRLSFGLYNTIEEIDRFIVILKEALSLLRK